MSNLKERFKDVFDKHCYLFNHKEDAAEKCEQICETEMINFVKYLDSKMGLIRNTEYSILLNEYKKRN